MDIQVPDDVTTYIKRHFSICNDNLSTDLSSFPAMHEPTLDMSFISYFSRHQAPVRLPSNWVVSIDSNFIGGGRHYDRWEVADLGLLMIFRRRGKVIRSKLAMLQSKKIYAAQAKHTEGPRYGLGSFLVSEAEHADLVKETTLKFKETSRYQAFAKNDDQQTTMGHFERRWGMSLHYLFYNPLDIPLSVAVPMRGEPSFPSNSVGCRVVPKKVLDQALKDKPIGYKPSYADLQNGIPRTLNEIECAAGWRMEGFAADLMLQCKEGFVDDSPNFESVAIIFDQKRLPMSAGIAITFDIPD
ncbi:MAG: hypothetical protein AAFR91_00085 [Pseudomonadota bacterium]